MEAKFNKAVEIIQSLPKSGSISPSQDEQLTFYGLYKQANEGDVSSTGKSRPGMMDFTGKYKCALTLEMDDRDAWKKNEGKSKEDAMKEYVDEFVKILDRVDDEESKKHKEAIMSA